ncbi:MAG TPA: ATP-binding protein [Nocardioides sp.]|nr:ATP-binding protein [Nocardioides sp.]
MDVRELSGLPLFAGLSEAQLTQLVDVSAETRADPGQQLWTEGQPADTWWVLLEGSVDLLKQVGKDHVVVGTMSDPGQWAGGFAAWDPNGRCFATGRAADGARLLAVPAAELGRLGDEWFAFGVHFIRGLVDTVRRVESNARQREALVALGTLAAGLAHEINNPAAAATRAVDSLATTSDSLVASLLRLASHGVSADQLARLEELRSAARPADPPLDRMAVADLEEELSDWLTEHGVDEEWLIAPALAAAGMDTGWCDRLAEVLGDGALAPGIEWVAHSLTVRSLLGEVKDATGRISGLVGAVRSYSQLDRAGAQPVDVAEGLESTLTMLAHKLKTVTVEKELAAGLPAVDAVPGELNQVWTNLIDNAVDAMDGAGTLRVATGVDEVGRVVVEIEDSGPGMPADVQARAFEPFYTTKDVGKGTGLGLDISRRIVERHSGEIAIDSAPGRTVMRVLLPAQGQLQAADLSR